MWPMMITSSIADLLSGAIQTGSIPGLQELWAETTGDTRVTIAVLDGPVDSGHSCFRGARLTLAGNAASSASATGRMAAHGTHVTIVLFGQRQRSFVVIARGRSGLR